MSKSSEDTLRRFIIDTDTGSDDVWAIIEALRATDVVRVEAITVVCGNLPLDLCVKNAMLAVDAAGTYVPPVYRGMERPLLNPETFYAPEVHGEDGLGGMDLPMPERRVETKHAMDAIIDLVMSAPGQIEIVTCGPLTNLAMALLKEPRLAESVKKVWVLGGSARGVGNMTPNAEFNVYADPEAASIVLRAGMDTTWVTWDSAEGETEITPENVAQLLGCGDRAAAFCARCTSQLREYYRETYGRDTYAVIDSLVMTAALYPEIMEGQFRANCSLELGGGEMRGFFRIDPYEEPNAIVCPAVNAAQFKKRLFSLLSLQGKGSEHCESSSANEAVTAQKTTKDGIVLLGGLLQDRYFHIDRWPVRGQDGFLEKEESFVGGCSINMAVTIHNLGGYAYIATCIGDDQIGRAIQCYLDDHGLSKRLVRPVPGATGNCLVFSEPEGERTFLSHTGVETIFPQEFAQDILSLVPAWIGVTGYYLLGQEPSRIMDCLEELHRSGTKVLFDPSPLVGDIQPEILERMVCISDILTPNSAELPSLGGESRIPTLVDSGKIVILKRGADGGTAYAPDQVFDYAGTPCETVDTTGAGDSFSGALLYAMTNQYPLRQAVELAARCAAKTCEVCGPHGFWKLEGSNHA